MTFPLYLPITSQPRELDAKLLLALFAHKNGLQPVLGYKSSFLWHLPNLQPGYYLAHNARQNPKQLADIRRFGNKIIVLDEEALVRQADEIFLRKHPDNAFSNVDKILAWGADDADLWERAGIAETKQVQVVGNPRFDLLRPKLRPFFEDQIQSIRAKFGRYILLNTNFPTVNNFTLQGGGVRMAKWGLDDRGQSLNDDFLDFKNRMLQAELDLIAPLALAIAPTTLIVRPHPNEDHNPWYEAARDLDNVKVAFEGGVFPWLFGSDALIHNNCTTGVEAAAAGVPIINFAPFRSSFDNALLHSLGKVCTDPKSVIRAVEEIASGCHTGISAEQIKVMRHHVASFDGTMSSQRIADFLASAPQDLQPGPWAGKLTRAREYMVLRAQWATGVAKLRMSKTGREKQQFLSGYGPEFSSTDLDHKQLRYSLAQLKLMMRQFPPLTIEYLENRLDILRGTLGGFAPVQVANPEHGLFRVE